MAVEPGTNANRLPKIYFRDPGFHRGHQEARTLKTTMQALAEEIALGLAREIRSHQAPTQPTVPRAIDQFVDQVAQEVVGRLDNGDLNGDLAVPANAQRLLQRLEQVESKLEKLTSGIRNALQEGTVTQTPALVGDGAKYQNIESLLKYIETPDGEGGVKLVIMNFND